MNVVGIVGSPRLEGTTDALVRKVLDGCEEAGAGTEVFHLGGLHIHGCIACMACNETGKCAQNDDMTVLYEKIREADALVLGTPIYFWYMTSQMKAFTDRLFAFMKPDFKHSLGEGRKTVFVVTQGAPEEDLFSGQIESMRKAWGYVGINIDETIIATGVYKSDQITGNDELVSRALEAGRSLVG